MIKVERSQGAPRALTEKKGQDRYRDEEVVKRLAEDFHEKCYLCELRPVYDPNVEHRLPHHQGAYQDRLSDWNNLFYSCAHCNGVKNKPKYEAGIIDCCARDPEALINQQLVEHEVQVTTLVDGDEEAQLTAELIEEVFMSDKRPLQSRASAARLRALQESMNTLYRMLEAHLSREGEPRTTQTIRAMLRRESKFAGFTRAYVRAHLDVFPEFADDLKVALSLSPSEPACANPRCPHQSQ